MPKIDDLGKLTEEETQQLALLALRNLPDDVALRLVLQWARETEGMADELFAHLDNEPA